jgi:hypothetical protein
MTWLILTTQKWAVKKEINLLCLFGRKRWFSRIQSEFEVKDQISGLPRKDPNKPSNFDFQFDSVPEAGSNRRQKICINIKTKSTHYNPGRRVDIIGLILEPL